MQLVGSLIENFRNIGYLNKKDVLVYKMLFFIGVGPNFVLQVFTYELPYCTPIPWRWEDIDLNLRGAPCDGLCVVCVRRRVCERLQRSRGVCGRAVQV